MARRVDGRPYRLECYANPDRDGPGISLTGFPTDYLTGATVTAPVWELGGTVTADAAWTVAVGATDITLSMPKADVVAIGTGSYVWDLLVTTAAGAAPPIIGGTLMIDRTFKPSASVASGTVEIDPIGVDVALTFTQTIGAASVIDGGVPAGTGTETVDGGAP